MLEILKENFTVIISLVGTIIGAIIGFLSTFIIEKIRNKQKRRALLVQKREDIYTELIYNYLSIKENGLGNIDDAVRNKLLLLKIKCYLYGSKEICSFINALDDEITETALNNVIKQAQKELTEK